MSLPLRPSTLINTQFHQFTISLSKIPRVEKGHGSLLRSFRDFLVCCCSVAKSELTLCNSMDCSTSGFPVLHYFLEFAQTHVHVRSNTTTSYCSSHSQVRKVELREVNFPQIRQLVSSSTGMWIHTTVIPPPVLCVMFPHVKAGWVSSVEPGRKGQAQHEQNLDA